MWRIRIKRELIQCRTIGNPIFRKGKEALNLQRVNRKWRGIGLKLVTVGGIEDTLHTGLLILGSNRHLYERALGAGGDGDLWRLQITGQRISRYCVWRHHAIGHPIAIAILL